MTGPEEETGGAPDVSTPAPRLDWSVPTTEVGTRRTVEGEDF